MKFILLVVMVVTMSMGAFSRRCRRNSQCGNDGFCMGGSIWRSGNCVSRRPDGSSCDDNNLCRSGQCTCNICGQKLANGKTCSTNDNCRNGWCNGFLTVGCRGTCQGHVADGGVCNDNNLCRSGQCTCATCGQKLANGKTCSTNDNCRSGWCNGFLTVGCRGTCQGRVADGGACYDNNQCSSGQCTCATCGQKLANGKTCSTNDNCRSGWCNGHWTVGCHGTCKERPAEGGRCYDNN